MGESSRQKTAFLVFQLEGPFVPCRDVEGHWHPDVRLILAGTI